MKRLVLIALVFAVLAGISVRDAAAQTDIAWNWGVVTDKSFSFSPFLWTTGFTFDFYINPYLSISPEVHAIIHNFDFGSFILAPAVLLNFQGQGFFIGGGVTKWWLLGNDFEGSPSSDVACKLNVGFRGYDIKLTAFVVTPFKNFFSDLVVGAMFGFYF